MRRARRRAMLTGPATRAEAERLYVAEQLLAHNREDIGRADTKASILVGSAVTVGALAAGPLLDPPATVGPTYWLIGVGGVTWVAGVVLLALAVLPRLRSRGRVRDVTYFGDVRRLPDVDRLRRHVEAAARDRLTWLLVQVYDTSAIVGVKYRCIRLSIGLFAVGAAVVTAGWVV